MTAEQVTDTLVLPKFGETVEVTPVEAPVDRQDLRRRAAVAACDAAAAVATAAALGWVLDSLPLQQALAVPAGWTITAWAVGAYHRRRLKIRLGDARGLLLTTVTLLAATSVVATLLSLSGARPLILAAVPATAVAAALSRVALRRFTRAGDALAAAPLVLYGPQDAVRRFCSAAGRDRSAPTIAAACITDLGRAGGDHASWAGGWDGPGGRGLTVVDATACPGDDPGAALDAVVDTVRRSGADTVVVTGHCDPDALRALSWRLEAHAVGVAVTPLWPVSAERVSVRTYGDATLVEVTPPRYDGARLTVRHLVDRAIAGLALVLLSPVLLGVAAAVKLTSPGPVFFSQLRTGQGGRRFRLLKFRTMVADAETLKAALATANQYTAGTLFKVRHDPRVTPVGGILRALSLDELPQLVNVLRGDMALVGPRPTATPPEQMRSDYRRRTLVKPGMTGLWQVSGRSNLPWEEAVRLDLRYVENRSLSMDFDIVCRTLPAVLSRDGAY
ncbi:exopolysaccharide biosynthesis polyprenyl glycosylphosphotransferase [Cryptosporangium arvum]|uniref:Exopolysaccharide biosynthesis polyprenyl glycosylphosphotransferase n=1 Tax=Cryptosporangium arvum DSM 44712 TaxID=927661 RepID=A0A010YXL4_9ACTN|nr:exopolysaccharide biosynthesis polyprenyl glycosylphosphotransferase [Cryptosporangium arvum]EXG79938.1 exopolysaccharide biosynthesis polyprenyl glycosylphosphotransferase [Cryptosporangium arvum DSM 44712]